MDLPRKETDYFGDRAERAKKPEKRPKSLKSA
jgi:hypothetical protein